MNTKRRTSILGIARAAFLFGGCFAAIGMHAQGLNNLWMGGYASYLGLPWGGTGIEFMSGEPVITYVDREMEYGRTSANITDAQGQLLFTTNGYYIADALGDTMTNGTGLNPCNYTSLFPDGLHVPQAAMVLPAPGQPDLYYLFHSSVDDQTAPGALFLYLSVVDMTLNQGLGAVTLKNHVLISDGLNYGKITAVRHANGRDWWVFCHKFNSAIYYRLLVTPEGVGEPSIQEFGTYRPPDGGQVCFSPDGSKFAYYWGEQELDVFDFDRCSGLFTSSTFIVIPDSNPGTGVAFSPNSRYLYVSSVVDVFQYDTHAPDIGASVEHIATWDGYYSPSPPFATMFDIAQLAPDGKVYIATGNSTLHLHVIHEPDMAGDASAIEQHGLELPTYFNNTLPNHPNYHLGPVDGSICDSLGINAGIPERGPPLRVSAYPNPSGGSFTLSYAAQAGVGQLEVRDLSGKLVLSERLPPWSTIHKVVLPAASAGMYQCRLTWGPSTVTTRMVVEP